MKTGIEQPELGENAATWPGPDRATFVGRAAGPPRRAACAVDEGAIHSWCRAIGDSLPVYRNPAFAARTRWGGIIAPPAMLQAWTMDDRPEPTSPGPEFAEAELAGLLVEHGYAAVVATNCEQVYLRPLRLGDTLTSQATITDIAGPKNTALGEGFFVTSETEFRDGSEELVGTMLFRSLRYQARVRADAAPTKRSKDVPLNPTIVVRRSVGSVTTETRRYDDVSVGDELPVLEIFVTPTLIVSGAIASRDFNVLHHDVDRAFAAGAPNIFMNILTTNGVVGRYVMEWAGPEAVLSRIAIRLGAPNYPYDTFALSGRVAAREERGDRRIVVLELRGKNSLGDHVTGSAELELP